MENQEYEFGPFRLVPEERQLLRGSESVTLPPKAFDLLLILVRSNGHVLKKDDLLKNLWPDAFVEENNLNQYISVLRKALRDGTNNGRYIETLPKIGYRFTGEVHTTNSVTESLGVHRRTRTHIMLKEEQSESIKTVGSKRPTIQPIAVVVSAVLIIGVTAGAYFGYIRPSRLRAGNALLASANSKSIDPAAVDAYRKGRESMSRRTPQDMEEAVRLFHEAIRLDPGYALAYVGLADAYLVGGKAPGELENYEELLQKAISIDETLAEAH